MARPREFDEQLVLDAATERFWTNGYEATSVRDLAETMGLTSASLYNAFGDKRALYRQVLDRYAKSALSGCANLLERPAPPLAAIERFFDAVVQETLDDAQRKGCFVVNTALELAPHDEDFRAVVSEVFAQIEGHFRRCVAAGQADGTITAAQPAPDLARLLLGALLGLRVLARTRPERAMLTGLTQPLFHLLQAG